MRWLYKLFLNPAPLGSLISSPSISTLDWLSLFVCVSAQVMYGASAASRHFGDVVLLRLDPLAAGEVLIRAGEHPRLLYGASPWASLMRPLIMRYL